MLLYCTVLHYSLTVYLLWHCVGAVPGDGAGEQERQDHRFRVGAARPPLRRDPRRRPEAGRLHLLHEGGNSRPRSRGGGKADAAAAATAASTSSGVQKVVKLTSLEARQANSLHWSPAGRFLLIAGLKGFNGQLEFSMLTTSRPLPLRSTSHAPTSSGTPLAGTVLYFSALLQNSTESYCSESCCAVLHCTYCTVLCSIVQCSDAGGDEPLHCILVAESLLELFSWYAFLCLAFSPLGYVFLWMGFPSYAVFSFRVFFFFFFFLRHARYVATSVTSVHQTENGFNVWSFLGKLLYALPYERFHQVRPAGSGKLGVSRALHCAGVIVTLSEGLVSLRFATADTPCCVVSLSLA